MPEDFTTYTEVDPNSHISVTSIRVTATGLIRNESTYVVKNKGTDFFAGNFEHKVDVNCTDVYETASGAFLVVWALSDLAGDFVNFGGSGGANCLSLFFNYGTGDGAGKIRLYMREVYGGSAYDSSYVLNQATTYYLTIQRSGTALTCKIYTDSSRTNLLTTLSLTLHAIVAYDLIYACASVTSGTNPTYWIDGYIENLILGGYIISGVTRDANGNPLGNCTVWLFKTGDKSFILETTSDANGNYSFTVSDAATQYFIRAHKDGTPNVFGTTDDNLTGV